MTLGSSLGPNVLLFWRPLKMDVYSLRRECIFAGVQYCQIAIRAYFNIPSTISVKECQVAVASPPLLEYTVRLSIPLSTQLDPRSESCDAVSNSRFSTSRDTLFTTPFSSTGT